MSKIAYLLCFVSGICFGMFLMGVTLDKENAPEWVFMLCAAAGALGFTCLCISNEKEPTP